MLSRKSSGLRTKKKQKKNQDIFFCFFGDPCLARGHDLLLIEAGRLAGARAKVVDAPLAEAVAEVELTMEWGERGQRTLAPETSTLTTGTRR